MWLRGKKRTTMESRFCGNDKTSNNKISNNFMLFMVEKQEKLDSPIQGNGTKKEIALAEAALPSGEDISVARWFAAYAMMLGSGVVALMFLLRAEPLAWGSWGDFQKSVISAGPAVKLLIFAIYVSLCCTFFPMNTSWIVSAVSMQAAAVTGQLWSTVVVVSLIGALASTVANLNDYHIFTLLMRSRHVSKVRHTRTYRLAIRWFEKSPFALLMIFNILPIPLDVVRPLAASHRYGRLPFAAANFLGRLGRYAVIATVTYMLGSQGWIAVIALLGLACLLTLPRLVKKLRGRASD
jgi:membrane protein YqaA with SNARE-associated domain